MSGLRQTWNFEVELLLELIHTASRSAKTVSSCELSTVDLKDADTGPVSLPAVLFGGIIRETSGKHIYLSLMIRMN